MRLYGQYCPIAHALDVLGDRWTLLIIRDLLTGTKHFNNLERGLPGISRALLSRRLRLLQQAGIVEKYQKGSGANTTEYHLTEAGKDLKNVITALIEWGAMWAFDDPRPEELDPALLLWWMHDRINTENLTQDRVVIEFNFYGAASGIYWLVLTPDEASVCLKPPGFEIDVVVHADIATFYQLWLGRINYAEALNDFGIQVDGLPKLVHAFPDWFAWSITAPAVHAAKTKRAAVLSPFVQPIAST
jgi:DNA-binding HxlR family transcriptional regulator